MKAGHSQINASQKRKNILHRKINISRDFSGFLPGPCLQEQSFPGWTRGLFSGSRGPAGPGRSTVRPAYSPALLAVFLKGFLCHSLHKFRIVPGEVFWEDHGDGVGIEELHNHLSDARGSTGVRSLGTHLGGKRVREGPKYWSK